MTIHRADRLVRARAFWTVAALALVHAACSASPSNLDGGSALQPSPRAEPSPRAQSSQRAQPSPSANQTSPDPGDTALFAVVVAAIMDETEIEVVEVDPRPMQPDPAIVMPNRSDLQPRAEEMTERRSEVLGRIGIEAIDFLEPTRCPGKFSALAQVEFAWQECKHERLTLRAIMGLPRPGGMYLPGTRTDEREIGLERGWSAVRVIHDIRIAGVRGEYPPSRNIVAYDYIVERAAGGGWAFVKKEPLFWLE